MKLSEFLLEAKKELPKKRDPNWQTLQAKRTSGAAGTHGDKKKELKQGAVKHKKELIPIDESVNRVHGGPYDRGDADAYYGRPFNPHKMVDNGRGNGGKVPEKLTDPEEIAQYKAGYQSGDSGTKDWGESIDRSAYNRDFKSSQTGFDRPGKEWDEGDTEPPNNFAISINGRPWKVFAGRGTHADDSRERNHYLQLKDWCAKKSAATGKKWEVHVTGEAPTNEGVVDTVTNFLKGTVPTKPASEQPNPVQAARTALQNGTAKVEPDSILGRMNQHNKVIKDTENELKEMAWLKNDPEVGHTLIPDGGMGSGGPDTWKTLSIRTLEQCIEMIKNGNYTGAEHKLYTGGFLEGALRSLARYQEFGDKQGKRPIAKGRQIDIGKLPPGQTAK